MSVAIVAGALANKPHSGGEAWVRLSWILGLRRLGFDVYFVERLIDGDEAAERYFEQVVTDFGLGERSGLIGKGGEALVGIGEEGLAEVAADAEVIFNISGHLGGGPILAAPRARVYVDLDPGFTQVWHADPGLDFTVAGHDHYLTVGQNIGRPGCPVPTAGIEWVPTLPPVLLDEWSAAPPPTQRLRFTTVATWRNPYGGLTIDGRTMSLKHQQFRRFAGLPARTPDVDFEIALDIHAGDAVDLEMLRGHGWEIVDPLASAATPAAFRDYVRHSGAEFSVAQGVYVEASTGWFSDRTAAYLASGRPALVQETGLADRFPVGKGLLSFSSLEEAEEGVRRVVADRDSHARTARCIGEKHLDSDRVLSRVLDVIGLG